jgi:hypothetical protein
MRALEVDLERRRTGRRRSRGWSPRRSPEDGPNACGELVEMERFGDVVVGAEVQPLGLVRGRSLGGEQDDRALSAARESGA